jgi:hypothetical protein
VIASDTIVRINLTLTTVFAVTATYAAAVFSSRSQWVGAITAMAVFAIGVFAFLWSYWNAVQRSRTEEIAVTQLYFLLGPAIPTGVRRVMNSVLFMQLAIAVITTVARPNGPDGNPGSSLAVGFLAPMLGFGMNGLWAAYYGNFTTRTHVRTSRSKIGQNAEHG